MVWILVSSISIHYHQRQQDVFHLPSLKLTQPLSKSCWKMFFLFPKVDMLVLLSVSTMGFSIHQLICTAKLHGFFQYAKQVACSTGWVLTSVTTHSSSSHKGRFCRRAQKDVLTQQKGTGTSNIWPKPASPPPPKKKQQLSTWWVSQPIRDCFRKLVNFFQLQKSPGFRTIHLPMWTPRLWDFGTDLRLVRFRNSNGNHRPL